MHDVVIVGGGLIGMLTARELQLSGQSIGEHLSLKGLYTNAGHFRNGIVTGPASARLLADIVSRRKPILDPAPYACA